eukprot:gene16985-23258_t
MSEEVVPGPTDVVIAVESSPYGLSGFKTYLIAANNGGNREHDTMASHQESRSLEAVGSRVLNGMLWCELVLRGGVELLEIRKPHGMGEVKGSPVAMKRSFLERKGLTEAEITEAFRRVPEEAPAALAVAQPSSQVPGLVTYAPAMQAQQPQQQLVAVAPSQALVAQPQYQPPAPPPPPQPLRWTQEVLCCADPGCDQGAGPRWVLCPPPPPQPLRWTQVALAVSVVAASAYTIRHLLFSYAYSMYLHVALGMSVVAASAYTLRHLLIPYAYSMYLHVALGVSVVAASAYTIRHLLFPYAYSMYEAWNGAAQKKEADRRRAEEEAREAKEALLNMQKELSAAAACLAEAVEMMREQSQTSDM